MSTAAPLTTRFAPSPTGRLHIGHAFSAFFAYDKAREAGGRFLLRIEDIDRTRCRPEFERGIGEDLAWLGLEWESPVRRQSDHMPDYQKALDGLRARGLLYPCFCTRAEIQAETARSASAPHGPEGALYPGTCRTLSQAEREDRLAENRPCAFRLDMEKAIAQAHAPLFWTDREKGEQRAAPEILGDVVLARKDVYAGYHLCVTLDDHLQGVTLVTRGADLFHATHLHRLLQDLLGLDVPQWHHHRLLLDENGKRFAKRDAALTLRHLREEQGLSPAAVLRLAGVREAR